MAYIGWIIAIIVIGMMAYPILQIIPNDQQKRQVAFRQAAMQRGLHIQIRHPELPPALTDEYSSVTRCAAYFKPAQTTLASLYTALRSNNDNEWFWLNDRRPPAETLSRMLVLYKELPGYCLAVEQNAAGTTLFLIDSLPVDRIDELENALDKLNMLISQ